MVKRVRVLGYYSFGTLEQFIRTARLKEHTGDVPPAKQLLSQLLNDHETVIRQLREDVGATNDQYNDTGTSDCLTGLMALFQHPSFYGLIGTIEVFIPLSPDFQDWQGISASCIR